MRKNARVTTAPYIFKACDQVLEISGVKTLTDLNDFNSKEDRFFTLSVLLLNEFKKKDVNSLVKSISFDNITGEPAILPGSVGCVKFRSDLKVITMCFDTEAKAIQFLQTYNTILDCRNGKSLDKFDEDKVKSILKASCKIIFFILNYLGLGLDIQADKKKFKNEKNVNKKIDQAIKSALLKVNAKSKK